MRCEIIYAAYMPFLEELMRGPEPASDAKYVLLKQFLRFAGAGAIGTAVQYVVLIALVQLAWAAAVTASFIGFVCGAFVNYFLSHRYVFGSSLPHREAMFKFFVIAVVGLGINTMIMAAGVHMLHLHYLLVQIIATGLVLLWNFGGNKSWTFREKGR